MKLTKMKKIVLAMSLGLGISVFAGTASAGPSCIELKDMCDVGNQWACITYNRMCWMNR